MGTAGLGIFLQKWSDAGVGCPKMDISGFTGVTIDIDATTVPNNYMYLGLSLGDGNAAEGTITTVAGTGSIRLPFGSLTNKNKCGSVTGPGVTGIYMAFPWFNDGASHPVDVMFSHIGFYGVGGTGGITSSSIGGTTSSNGGTTSFYGGTTSAGGTTKVGGTTSAGGIAGTGGAVETGGTSAGAGGSNVGGAPATGGLATTGGAIATGGASAAGGAGGTSAMTLAQACAKNCALASGLADCSTTTTVCEQSCMTTFDNTAAVSPDLGRQYTVMMVCVATSSQFASSADFVCAKPNSPLNKWSPGPYSDCEQLICDWNCNDGTHGNMDPWVDIRCYCSVT
jgi:hypothetical protein